MAALTLGQTTIYDLRTRARQRCDQTNSQFIADLEMNSSLLAAYRELYDILIQAYGEDYYVATVYPITTDGTNDTYSLTTDFYKLLGVDVQYGGFWVPLRTFNFGERGKYLLPGTTSASWPYALRYRLRGNLLWLLPLPSSGNVVRLWYAPRPAQIQDIGTVTLSGVVAGDTFTINGSVFTAIAGANSGASFQVGGTDTITATNLVTAIGTQFTAATLTAASSGAVVTVTLAPLIGVSVATWTSSAHMLLTPGDSTTWTNVVDGVSGWEDYIVTDVAIRAMQKNEDDPTTLMAQKQALLQRIEAAASNRDAGMPKTVTDVSRIWPFAPGGFATPFDDGEM